MRKILGFALIFALSALCIQPAHAANAVAPELVQVAPRLTGQLYRPAAGAAKKNIGILLMHPSSDYFNHPMAVPMASRGYTVLVSNTRFTNHGDGAVVWDDAALDMKKAVECLKSVPGVEKIVLVGHSGGGPLSVFYQNIAENGAAAGQGSEKILPVSDELNGLPKADALILLDSHLGSGFAALINKDPSVVAEGVMAPARVDESLNMYLPQNGFNPAGTTYTAEWKARFYAAQADRNSRLLTYAQRRAASLAAGGGAYPDSEPIIVPRNYARLFLCDLSALSHTRGEYAMLTVNGVKNGVVKSIRSMGINKMGVMAGESDNLSYSDGTLVTDIHTYLSSYAIRASADFRLTEDDILGVDFASSNTSAPANLAGVRVPVLNIGMTAHYWVVPSEINHRATASSDKTLIYIEGASHGLLPSKPEFGDTVGMIADYANEWLGKRF